ncbi:MAG TPA: hypothetical protein VF323_00800, partial [Candidatus Limnocylindrales bacterium]
MTEQVKEYDAEQAQDYAEVSMGAMGVAKAASTAVEVAGGEAAAGTGLAEGAGVLVEAAAGAGEIAAV